MAKKKLNHRYLLSLYSRVDEFLGNENTEKEELPDSVVSFCIVVEKVLKIKLHNKNPLLAFDVSCIKDDDKLSIIALGKEEDINTAKIENIIYRFSIVFKKIFTPGEFQALKDIYKIRNCFVHGHKSEDKIVFDPEDMVKKMGMIWEKVSKIAISLFGKESIKDRKPKKKYTENELEKVLENEVRKIIQPSQNAIGLFGKIPTIANQVSVFPSVYAYGENKCPRCGSNTLSLSDNKNEYQPFYWPPNSGYSGYGGLLTEEKNIIYKCKNCNLELTEKQYEIAKKIIGESKY